MKKGTLVRLKTFLGTTERLNTASDRENYWRLIGEKGVVVEEANFNSEKLLVLFEVNINELNLENHNPIKNSLYIDKFDLELFHTQ